MPADEKILCTNLLVRNGVKLCTHYRSKECIGNKECREDPSVIYNRGIKYSKLFISDKKYSLADVMSIGITFIGELGRMSKINTTRDHEDEVVNLSDQIRKLYFKLEKVFYKIPVEWREAK